MAASSNDGTPIPVTHRLVWQSAIAIEVRREGGAECDSIVGRRGLDEDFVDRAGCNDFAVGFGIEGNTAGETEIFRSGFCKGHLHHGHHGCFAGFLHRKGDILVTVGNFGFRLARRTEQRCEVRELGTVTDKALSCGLDTARRWDR